MAFTCTRMPFFLAVAVGAAGYAVSRFVLTEQFESTTRIYVLNRQNDSTLTYSDVQLGTQLTKDFPELIKSRYVAEQPREFYNRYFSAFPKSNASV